MASFNRTVRQMTEMFQGKKSSLMVCNVRGCAL